MKKLAYFMAVIISLSMLSCIDYKEKMKLNNDGSGEITFAIGLSEDLIKMGDGDNRIDDFNEDKIKKDYENKEGITFVKSRSYTNDGNVWIEITLEFNSVENLVNASKDSTSAGMIGQISLSNYENDNWVFQRGISNDNFNSKNNPSESDSDNMMALMFSKSKWH